LEVLHNIFNMGWSDLPDMYAQSPRAAGIHIRQTMSAHVPTIKYIIGGQNKLTAAQLIFLCGWAGNTRNFCFDTIPSTFVMVLMNIDIDTE